MPRLVEATADYSKQVISTRIPAAQYKALEARAHAEGYTTARYLALLIASHLGAELPAYSQGRQAADVGAPKALPRRAHAAPKQTQRIARRQAIAELAATPAPAELRRDYSHAEFEQIAADARAQRAAVVAERVAQQPAAPQTHEPGAGYSLLDELLGEDMVMSLSV